MKKLCIPIALCLALFIASCGGDDDGPLLIEFETIDIGQQSPIEITRSEHVLNDDPEYQQLFGTAPTVDFDRETVIAVFLGPLGNDGNTFEVTEVIDEGSFITVRITWRVPRLPAGDDTSPYHIIKTRKLSRPINFSTLEIRE